MLDEHTLLLANIIEELGLESLPEEEKVKLVAAMTDLVGQRVMFRAIDSLPEEDAQRFDALLETNPAAAAALLKEKLPTLSAIIEDEAVKFKDEIGGVLASEKEALLPS